MVHRSLRNAALTLALLAVGACGGGGGGGGSSGGGGSGGGTPPVSGPSPSQPVAPAPVTTLEIGKAGKFAGAFLQSLYLTRVYSEELRADVTSPYEPGDSSAACDSGGTVSVSVSSDRLSLVSRYANCGVDVDGIPATLNGTVRTQYSRRPGSAPFNATVTFEAFEVAATGGPTEVTRGTLRYEAGQQDVNRESRDRMILDFSVESSLEGTLRLVDLAIDIDNTLDFLNGLSGVSDVSGEISHNVEGRLAAGFDTGRGVVTLSGTGTEVARTEILSGRYYTTFHANDSAVASAHGRLSLDDVRELVFFDETISYGPIRRTSLILDLRNVLVIKDDTIAFSLRDNFFDRDGDVLSLDVQVTAVVSEGREGPATNRDPGDVADRYTLIETESGLYEFSSALDDELTRYSFSVHASDSSGLQTVDPLAFAIDVYRDFDGDNDPDRFDNDDDGDSVFDWSDAFPLDATESVDTDGDGIGDNADTDDDNDAVADVDDFYPLDPRCDAQADGNGTECWFSRFSSRIDATIDRDGIVYLYDFGDRSLGSHTVFRYDSRNEGFLTSFALDPAAFGLDPNQADYSLEYVAAHHDLYVRYHDALVTKIDLSEPGFVETLFHTRDPDSLFLNRVYDFDPWIGVFEQAGLGVRHWFSYDADGVLIDTYSYDANVSAESMTAPESSSVCDEGHAIARVDGLYFEYSNPGKYDCRVFGEPLASPDGQEFLTFTGEVLDPDLNLLRTLPFSGPGGSQWRWAWTADGIWIGAAGGADLYSADGILLDSIREPAVPVSAFNNRRLVSGSAVAVIFEYSEGIRIAGWGGIQP
ncbi:MAG: hypothetical protein KJO56_12210 [Gammaproteobacteria bacterium]|nr:hypothetical protein [Gammaproteobacteria bacterium]MBT8106312.1 hypothetical protein [Gammaproteobacteria bacterium]NNK26326.1 hypothetical protein [Woeseiaceae bacterium]